MKPNAVLTKSKLVEIRITIAVTFSHFLCTLAIVQTLPFNHDVRPGVKQIQLESHVSSGFEANLKSAQIDRLNSLRCYSKQSKK